MKKLFKLLSLIRFVQDLRHGRRGHHGGYHQGHHHGGYPPPYGRPRKLKAKHILRDLVRGRRY